jgi:preprotein translocase subunit SecE
MPADKTVGDEQRAGRRRRPSLTRKRPKEIEEIEEADDETDDEAAAEERGLTVGKGRATPSRRQEEEVEKKKTGNLATRVIGGLREYVEGVRTELGKVVWPTREEIRRLTVIVLVTLVAASLILGTISLIFTELFRIGLNSPVIPLGAMFIAVAGGLIYTRISSRRSPY